MGLNISHRCVMSMNGKLEVSSNLNHGSTFTIRLRSKEYDQAGEKKKVRKFAPFKILDRGGQENT